MQEFDHSEEGYKRWAKEYLKSADQMQKKINELKQKRKTAFIDEINIINHDIDIYKEMYYDCSETAKILLNTAKRIANKKEE